MREDFTLAGYRALLAAFQERGYRVCGYDEARAGERHLILRHDLDMCLQAAEPIAKIEHEAGVVGWYFVLLRTEMYNPFSAAARRTLSRLRALGHHIGLHLDASLYGDDTTALEAAARQECRVLEEAAEGPVCAISFHRPEEGLLDLDRLLAGRPHAYQPRYFTEMGYCSDSRGGWHHGSPLAHPAVKERRALQLLTHPIWWSREAREPVQARLDHFARGRLDLLRRELARNCSVYEPAKTDQTS